MKKTKKQIFSLLIITVLFSVSFLFFQACLATNITDQMNKSISSFDLPKSGGDPEGMVVKVVGKTIGAFLSVFGIIFLALMIFGGYKWMMASGREEEIKKAKDTIKAAMIGLTIVVMAYAITFFITTALQTAVK